MGLSPEEIRHVSIKRRMRGYDRRETDRLLADIAQSFEGVWHQRTRLHEEVNRLQADLDEATRLRRLKEAEATDLNKRLRDTEAELANVGNKANRLESDREAVLAESDRAQAELADLRVEIARLEDERSRSLRHEQPLREELAQLREEAARMRADRGRLLEELRQGRQELVEGREELVAGREELDRLKAERSGFASGSQRLTDEVDELQNEVARLEAERNRLLQDSARWRAESAELRAADRSKQAELTDARKDLQRLETEHATLRRQLEEVGAELGMHPRVARRLRELEEAARDRYRHFFSPMPEGPERKGDAEPPASPDDRETAREADAADGESGLLDHLTPDVTPADAEGGRSEQVNRSSVDG
jgi:DivIVA domain-containing protein